MWITGFGHKCVTGEKLLANQPTRDQNIVIHGKSYNILNVKTLSRLTNVTLVLRVYTVSILCTHKTPVGPAKLQLRPNQLQV